MNVIVFYNKPCCEFVYLFQISGDLSCCSVENTRLLVISRYVWYAWLQNNTVVLTVSIRFFATAHSLWIKILDDERTEQNTLLCNILDESISIPFNPVIPSQQKLNGRLIVKRSTIFQSKNAKSRLFFSPKISNM